MTNPDAPRSSALPTRQVNLGGRDLSISFNMKAVARLEDAYDLPIKKVAKRFVAQPVLDDDDQPILVPAVDEKGVEVVPRRMVPKLEPQVRVSDLQKIIWASLAEHHPEITKDQVLDLLDAEMTAKGVLDDVLSTTFDAWTGSGDRPPAGEGQAPDPQTRPTTPA